MFLSLQTRRFVAERCKRLITNRLILASVFAVLVGSGHFGLAQQQVTLRFLDVRSGKPIDNLQVFLTFWNDGVHLRGKIVPTRDDVVRETQATTDKDGVVAADVPQPIPGHLDAFSFDLAYPFNHDFSPVAVIASGVIAQPRHQKLDSKIQASAKPGEIVILNKRLTAVDRMRREIP